MQKPIIYQQTLFYYDLPLLFHGTDNIGVDYICLLVDEADEKLKYICVQISKERLKKFLKGYLDLRFLFSQPEINEFYKCEISTFNKTLYLEYFPTDILPESMLPEEGFFYHDRNESDDVVNKAREQNKPVIYASLQPPESQFSSKIIADRLSLFLHVFQNFVKHAYRKTCKNIEPTSVTCSREEAYKLNVIGFAEGSFTVIMDAVDAGDITGSNPIENSIMLIDEIAALIKDTDESFILLKKNKGHLVNAYINLLRFLSDNKTSLEYSWASPVFDKPRTSRLDDIDAKPLLEFLTLTEDISSESVELIGSIIKADKNSKTWKLLCDADGKEYPGKVKEDIDLSLEGIVIGAKYKFICEEKIEETPAIGKEKVSLKLISFEPLE